MLLIAMIVGTGSSPRGRGKRQVERRHEGVAGLIPAWAGKTAVADLTEERSEAHPRMGGENSGASGSVPPCVGSSPRGRGKPMEGVNAVGCERLIPARAGKTSHGPDHRLASTAHPRMGGENAEPDGLVDPTPAHPRAGGENSVAL